ncbi:MAG: hypothetical protein ACR2KZ_12870 [Segetibacter sp.]
MIGKTIQSYVEGSENKVDVTAEKGSRKKVVAVNMICTIGELNSARKTG